MNNKNSKCMGIYLTDWLIRKYMRAAHAYHFSAQLCWFVFFPFIYVQMERGINSNMNFVLSYDSFIFILSV